MKYNGAIFDVDGVLVDSPHERAWRDALRRLMEGGWRDLGLQTSYTPERFTTAIYQEYVAGKPRMAGATAALAFFGLPDPDGSLAQAYADQKQEYLIWLVQQGEFTAFADALRFIVALKDAGLKLGAASSSKNANLFLSKVELWPFAAAQGQSYSFIGPDSTLLDLFDANLCGRDFAQGKPHPEIFLTAAAELGLPPAQCVVIEDAVSGVQAARAGGIDCIGVARLDDAALLHEADATLVVTSLDEVDLSTL